MKAFVLRVAEDENAYSDPGTHHVKETVLLFATDLNKREGDGGRSFRLLPGALEESKNGTDRYAAQLAITRKHTGSILLHVDGIEGVIVYAEMGSVTVVRQRTIRWKDVLPAFHEVQLANSLDSVLVVLVE